jgi:hypothetical protein
MWSQTQYRVRHTLPVSTLSVLHSFIMKEWHGMPLGGWVQALAYAWGDSASGTVAAASFCIYQLAEPPQICRLVSGSVTDLHELLSLAYSHHLHVSDTCVHNAGHAGVWQHCGTSSHCRFNHLHHCLSPVVRCCMAESPPPTHTHTHTNTNTYTPITCISFCPLLTPTSDSR